MDGKKESVTETHRKKEVIKIKKKKTVMGGKIWGQTLKIKILAEEKKGVKCREVVQFVAKGNRVQGGPGREAMEGARGGGGEVCTNQKLQGVLGEETVRGNPIMVRQKGRGKRRD